MSDLNTAAPVENVGRGTLFALLSIPLAVVAFAISAGYIGVVTFVIGVVIPAAAGWLYAKGARAPLSRKGWLPFVIVCLVALILGVFAAVVSSAYAAFSRVGGDGGILSPAFWTTVRNQGLGENTMLPLISLAVGVIAIVGVLRGNGRLGNRATQQAPLATVAPPTAPPAPAAPLAPPAANQPSPGIILNGKPLDPDAKR